MHISERAIASAGLRLGLSSGALYPTPTEEVPALAARHGFADLEIMLQTAGEYDAGFVRMLARRCRDAGCRVHAVHLWHNFHLLMSPYARRVEEGRAMFDRVIEAAVELDAPVLVWHGADKRDVATLDDWQRFVTTVVEQAAVCAAAQRTLAIENVSWCALSSVREVSAFSSAVTELDPERRIGFAFDVFQAAEANANPFMLLAAMGDRVVDVHLSDKQEVEAAPRHLPPGEGDLPWSAVLRAIAASYRGPMMFEGGVGSDFGRLDRSRQQLQAMLDAVRSTGEDPCAGTAPAGLIEGIRLFNDREFYECHEAIEHEWHAERRPVRRLYQGILQIGVGFHHALSGNHRGALLLLHDGIEKTAGFVPSCLGIDTRLLVSQSQACLDRLTELGPARVGEFDPETIPRIRIAGDAIASGMESGHRSGVVG